MINNKILLILIVFLASVVTVSGNQLCPEDFLGGGGYEESGTPMDPRCSDDPPRGYVKCAADCIAFSECDNYLFCPEHAYFMDSDGVNIYLDCRSAMHSYCETVCVDDICIRVPNEASAEVCTNDPDLCITINGFRAFCPSTYNTYDECEVEGRDDDSPDEDYVQYFRYMPKVQYDNLINNFLRKPGESNITALVNIANQPGVVSSVDSKYFKTKIYLQTGDLISEDYPLLCTLERCGGSLAPPNPFYPVVNTFTKNCMYLNMSYDFDAGEVIAKRAEIISTFPIYPCQTRTNEYITPSDYRCMNDASNHGNCIPNTISGRSYSGFRIGADNHPDSVTLNKICQIAGYERLGTGAISSAGGGKARATVAYYDGNNWKTTGGKGAQYLSNTGSLQCSTNCFNHTQARKFHIHNVIIHPPPSYTPGGGVSMYDTGEQFNIWGNP